MSADTLVLWLQIWYIGATVLWTLAGCFYTRLYVRALIVSRKRYLPFLISAIVTAFLSVLESGFYAYIVVAEPETVGLRRLAAALLPVGIALGAVIYIAVGYAVTRKEPSLNGKANSSKA